MQNKKSKKLSIVVAITMLSVALVGTTAFASSRLYDSVEGIGIEVHCTNPNARGMLRITMLVFQGERFGPHGELREYFLELIMTILLNPINVQLVKLSESGYCVKAFFQLLICYKLKESL